jgi:hypothetical protein
MPSSPALSKLLPVGGFPFATVAPFQCTEDGPEFHVGNSCGVTIQLAYHDQISAKHLDLDAQFLQPTPVQNHGAGASPGTHQHCS